MPDGSKPRLSILIPCYNEARFIGPCLDSLLKQNFALEQAEVFIIDGGSNDGTQDIIKSYIARHPYIVLLHNAARAVPQALNLGIENSHGDIIMRLDVHCEFPENYITELLQWQSKLAADNVGAVLETRAANDSERASAIATACSHPFGVGNSHFRIGSGEVKQVDTVPFGCYRRSVFDDIGLFDEELVRNQDDEFNGRLLRNGGSIYLIPDIVATYYPRSNLGALTSMYYQYGLYKPLVAKKLGAPVTARQLVPLGLVLWLLGSALIAVFSLQTAAAVCTVLLVYELTAFGFALLATVRSHSSFVFLLYLLAAFNCLHFAYGWGYLRGLLRILIGRPFGQPAVSR